MVFSDLDKFVYINDDTIICSKSNLDLEDNLKIKYKIDKENKEIRLYDVPRILSFQEKSLIYYALLDNYYFYPLKNLNKEYKNEDFENYVVRENGYTYHEFNGIQEPSNGILGELIFEISRQKIESEKLSRIRDIYDLLIRNKYEIGVKPICIAFNGIMPDFKDIYKTILYMFNNDKVLKKLKNKVFIYKKSGFLGGNKRIYIVNNKLFEKTYLEQTDKKEKIKKVEEGEIQSV